MQAKCASMFREELVRRGEIPRRYGHFFLSRPYFEFSSRRARHVASSREPAKLGHAHIHAAENNRTPIVQA